MRIPFLLLPLVLLLAACVGNPPPPIPPIQPPSTTSSAKPLSPVEHVGKELEKASFAEQNGQWEKKGKNGIVYVTVTSEGSTGVNVVARFERPDGVAICQIQAVKLAGVPKIIIPSAVFAYARKSILPLL